MDPTGTVALLSKLLRGVPKLPGALCRGRGELFVSDDPDDTAAAVDVCHQCPELAACQTWAAKQRKLFGVVAGRTYPPQKSQPKGNTHE
jgi:hypothetical protein